MQSNSQVNRRFATSIGALPIGTCLLLFFSVGCDQVPTFQEITGQEQAEKPQTPPKAREASRPASQPAAEPALPAAPAGPSPEEVISEFKKMTSANIGDGHLKRLAELSEGLDQITELDLHRSKVTNAGLQHLSKLTDVTSLVLSGMNQITDAGLAPLSQLSNLQTLVLTGTNVGLLGLEGLRGMASLETLALAQTRVGDADLGPVGTLLHLKSLDLQGTLITDQALAHFQNLHELETLVLTSTRINGSGMVHLREVPLKNLSVSQSSFGNAGFQFLHQHRTLENLQAGNAEVMDLSIKGFHAPNLKILNLSFNKLTEAAFERNALALPDLEELNLASNRFLNEKAFNTILKFKKLTKLNLEGTACTPDAARELKRKYLPNVEIKLKGATF